jgi:superfamily II DNA/RNA helicase
MLFSATLDAQVEKVAKKFTRDARRHEQAQAVEARGDVEHRFVGVDHTGKLNALVRELTELERGRTLVFVRTKRGADRLVKRLKAHDVQALAMHGDKTQGQRERALARFTSGDVHTLIATDVAARGLDVDDITHVINFDAPAAREDYVHRVGRTGRAGRTGVGITFVIPEQRGDMSKIARELDLDSEFAAVGGRSSVAGHAPSGGRGSAPSGGRGSAPSAPGGNGRPVHSARPKSRGPRGARRR